MPNVSKLLAMGAANVHYEMIGGHPTVTPPMWTTLATGASPYVHGVTDFFKRGENIGDAVYNFDSRNCQAEQYWNCLLYTSPHFPKSRAGYLSSVLQRFDSAIAQWD